MSERIGNHGWRIWKENSLPQEVVPLCDAEGVVAQLEAELATCRERIVRYAKERVAIVKAKQALEDALLTEEDESMSLSDVKEKYLPNKDIEDLRKNPKTPISDFR